MYESYYGLTEEPFNLTANPRFFYRSETHASALELLEYAVGRHEGFVVLTGEPGTGKTTVCRALVERLDRRSVGAHLVGPYGSEEDLLWLILEQLGVVTRGQGGAPAARPTRQQLVATLHDFLRALVPLDARVVLLVDDAHDLPFAILEQIRILSNFETETDKLLQIFLVGEPRLVALLRSTELRQLDQRVSIRYQLKPLAEEEVGAYVSSRLAVANARNTAVFSPAALRILHTCSGGVPRVINMLCDRALQRGHSARIDSIGEDLVIAAAEELELEPLRANRSWFERLLGRSRS